MKANKFFYALAATAMLGLSACSSEEPVLQGANGEGNVTFTLQLPEVIGSRAYSDGLSATKLSYYVYDEDNSSANIEALNGTATFTNRETTVTLNLVSGKSYSIVFLATVNGQTHYTYTASTKDLAVTYGSAAQDETRDAFYVYEPTFKVTGAISKTVTLKRPFAQVNVGTTDWAKATAGNISLTETSMTVTGVANKINLGTGEVEGNEEVTFTSAAMPATAETFPYAAANVDRYLAMNYILVGADKSTVDVKLNTNATPAINEMVFSQVPVQRNYRTNIYGALLTNPAVYKVVIDESYDGEPGHNIPAGKVRVGSTIYDDLGAAFAAVQDNDVVVLPAGEFNGQVRWPENKTFSIKGQGRDATTISNLTGEMGVAGSTVTMDNLTLQVLKNPYNHTNFGFAHTVNMTYNNVRVLGEMHLYATGTETFNNCELNYWKNSDPNNGGAYPIWVYGSHNAVFNKCVFNNEFSAKGILLFGYQDDYNRNVTVNNCTFNCTGISTDKGAVEIHTEQFTNAAGTIIINNSTYSEKYEKGLWNEQNNTTGNKTETFKVIVDGVTVQEGNVTLP